MSPTLPKTCFRKRGLARLTTLLLLLIAAAVFHGCKKRKKMLGIDTPIVISGGSLKLFSDTPFTSYKKDNDKQISHPKEENRVVRVKVEHVGSVTTVLYNEAFAGHCRVKAFYTGSAGDDVVRVDTKSNGKGLKIHFDRVKYDRYGAPDANNREHPDRDNNLTKVEIKNASVITDVTCPSGNCTVRFTYED